MRLPHHPTHRSLVIIALFAIAFVAGCHPTHGASRRRRSSAHSYDSRPGARSGTARPLLTPIPYINDPVALQDGRRLFNWYNCSGCHGGHARRRHGPQLARSGLALRLLATTRSSIPSLRAAPTACPHGAPRSPPTRSGNWSPTSSPCAHRRSRIRQRTGQRANPKPCRQRTYRRGTAARALTEIDMRRLP